MDLLNNTQVVKDRGISQRCDDILCKKGRGEGAIMMENRWFIPPKSPKLEDRR